MYEQVGEGNRVYSGDTVYPVTDGLTQSGILTPGGVIMTGEELKRLRISKNMTQKKLGELLGYKGRSAENVVQLWEYGKQPVPMKHWRPLAKILEIPLEKFIP